MPDDVSGSSLARRMIGVELRTAREKAGVSAEAAAKAAEISRQTLWKIEGGQPAVKVQNKDIRALASKYGVAEDRVAGLLKLAEITRVKGWYSDFIDLLPSGFDMYVGLEGSAAEIDTFEVALIPGLMQTEAYARAMISSVPGRDEAEIDRRVKVRLLRQQIITRSSPEPTGLNVVLYEAVLRRQVGSPAIMAEQLARIQALNELPNVETRILPFTTSTRADLLAGPFILLRFPDGGGTPVTYVDGFTETHGAKFYDREKEIARYEDAYQDIHRGSLDAESSVEFINRLAKEYSHG